MALTPAAGAVPLAEAVRRYGAGRACLVLGSEGPGLTPHWLAAADVRVTIPMAPGVDSLNVAAASAVAFYALQQLSEPQPPIAG
jgi:tRNA G18 (ribose-2'-O)-methylase SpoU